MPNQPIWSPRCWTFLKAQQDAEEKYICPKSNSTEKIIKSN